MGMKLNSRRMSVALAVLTLLGLAGAARAGEDDALRKQALLLNEITGSAPMRGRLLALMEDSAGTKKLLGVAKRMTKEKPQPFNRNATLLLALAAENLKDVETSATFYRIHGVQSLKLVSARGVATSYGGLIQLYFDNKKYADCEKMCRELLGIESDEDDAIEELKPAVIRRLILTIAKQGQFDRALGTVDKLIKADPKNWLIQGVKAQVLREADRLEDAVKIYLSIIDQVSKDKRLQKEEREDFVSDYRYILSGLYVDMKQIDKAADQLKMLLAKEPNNPTYNNDLGYIWADHGKNLAEAEKLIRKAIEEERKQRRKAKPDLKPEHDRDNSAYLDSLGWVLFKQGKAKEAKPHLLEAVKGKEGQHTEIYDHLGDVHMALGEKTQAIAVWKKAIEVAGSSKREQARKVEVEKKLKAATE
jgi:tetratricopeptide (TPR) repeat protein